MDRMSKNNDAHFENCRFQGRAKYAVIKLLQYVFACLIAFLTYTLLTVLVDLSCVIVVAVLQESQGEV